MDRERAISLNSLALSHSDDIDEMLAAIGGNPGITLWTSEMRAAVRGGKPLGTTIIDASSLAETD